jgi:hypothetical protein
LKILITTNQTKASLVLTYLLKEHELFFGTNYINFPKAESESLAHEILAFCLDHHITEIYPVRLAEVEALLKAAILFSEYDICINFHHLNHQNNDDTAFDFLEFSLKALKLGYPNQQVAIGLANQTGKIFIIKDEVKDFNQLWFEMNSLSFLQVGKLFNNNQFQSLGLFNIEDGLDVNYLLIRDNQMCFHRNEESSFGIIPKEIYESLKNGFYTIYSSGSKLLRLSNF